MKSASRQSKSSVRRVDKIIDFAELESLRGRFSASKIVHCHGVFDILHPGHLAYLESAKKFGDLLVVSVTADEFVNKGPGRPYFAISVRANMLAALEIVDFVVVSRFPTAVPAITALKPHFYVKGPDYAEKSKDPTGGIFLEEKAVQRGGGRLVTTADDTYSSSELINKFFSTWTPEQQAAIEAVKKAGGMPEIERLLDKLSKQSIVIVGEPIVDTYIFCVPEAISSKSPSISARYSFEENYAGGSLAIANHLADFVKDATLLTTHGAEPYFKDILNTRLDRRVRLIGHELADIPTPRKSRYVVDTKVQRIFEITDLRADQWLKHPTDAFCKQVLDHSAGKDCVVVADFGHGIFEGAVLASLAKIDGFIGLNVQTNSSNFAFNPFTKHKNFSYLSIDLKEARLAYHDRFTEPKDLARQIARDFRSKDKNLAMTLGPYGSFYVPGHAKGEFHVPAFDSSVVDAIGAGDVFFGLTSLLLKAGCPDVMLPFLGNVFAGLKTKIIGHKSVVSRAQLIKAISSILR